MSESDQIKQIKTKLKKNLSNARYEHTLGVAYTAAALAMRYHADMNQALLAGLLHDCAKCLSISKLHKILLKYDSSHDYSDEAEEVLHAFAGPYIALNEYHIEDPEILDAIRYHTTGKADMTLLEKIIFIADYIEPNRRKASNLGHLREIAFQNLDHTIFLISQDTIQYLESKNTSYDPKTIETYEFYQERETN